MMTTVPMWKVMVTSELSWVIGFLEILNQDGKFDTALEKVGNALKLVGEQPNDE